jgi:uncharacterized protein YcfJ
MSRLKDGTYGRSGVLGYRGRSGGRYCCRVPGVVQARGAYDTAQVVRAQPIYQRVSVKVPVEYCELQQVAERPRSSGPATAPVLGAIIGGAIGNAVGSGKSNKRVGAVAGAVMGGAIGYDMSRQGRPAEPVPIVRRKSAGIGMRFDRSAGSPGMM